MMALSVPRHAARSDDETQPAETTPGAEKLQFNRDIRPILSDRCFACHGPDKNKRSVDMRLDVRESAIENLAIVPGKPDESQMLHRIIAEDADVQMPPPSAKLGRLTKEEVDTLRRWIAEGAEYEPHWAFISLMPVSIPENGEAHPIDALITERLKDRGLSPQSEADKTTLLRRVSFDITGLPPTPEEVAAFLADDSADAYEKVVDRLLASERYGERMAVDWLDVSRYADSFGFQVDRERDVWAWRDWVINAFNRNQPFDEFVTWQLAGDMLPNASTEQILATAFNRLHQQETEGGSVPEEYRVEYVCDRVQTFATAFLGLTFECSRCHDHKFDPIKQSEFYGLFAMFQNIDEAGLYSYYHPETSPSPTLWIADASAQQKLAEFAQKVATLEQQGTELRESRRDAFNAWLENRPAELALKGEVAHYDFESLGEGNKLTNAVAEDKPAILNGENKLVAGKHGQSVLFTGDDAINLPLGNYQRHQPFSISLWLNTPDVKERAVVFHRSPAWTDGASRGYELLISEGKLRWSLIHFWPGNAISIETREPVPTGEWLHVALTTDGSSRAAGLKMWINGQAADVVVLKDHLTKDLRGGGGGENIALAARNRDRGFKQGMIDDFRVVERDLTSLEVAAAYDAATAISILQKPLTELTTGERESLFDYYLATVDQAWIDHIAALTALRGEQVAFAEGIRELMVMQELPEPKPSYILFRGEYAERRDEVPACVPAALSPFPEGAPNNRLGLAQWLTSREHPLLARVTVNRIWQNIFGMGLVKTAEDFGSQGTPPVYPGVLDWLALHFIESGWDTKDLIKTIVMSKTYRQRSIADAKTMEDDPENLLLARGPRFRLQAEMIRDNVLAASGLLKNEIGGAPVYPYEMTESFKPHDVSGGDGVYRRSVYTHWRRTGPPPAMLAFDAPRRAVCTARRERTESPLQPLILLNGVQYVEAAKALGESAYKQAAGDVAIMIDDVTLRSISRKPDAREVEILTQLYHEQLEHFTAHPEQADELLKIGQRPHDAEIPAPHAAAATVLAQALLNHDEAVVKR